MRNRANGPMLEVHLFIYHRDTFFYLLSFFSKLNDSYKIKSILGIMCTATALIVGRRIHLVGTVNYGGQRQKYTPLDSIPGSEDLPPFTIGYIQVCRDYLIIYCTPLSSSGLIGEHKVSKY